MKNDIINKIAIVQTTEFGFVLHAEIAALILRSLISKPKSSKEKIQYIVKTPVKL
ncbi:MAG: hypothetical protein WCW17_02075 [Patescibacteria group bacterium]